MKIRFIGVKLDGKQGHQEPMISTVTKLCIKQPLNFEGVPNLNEHQSEICERLNQWPDD